MHTPMKSQKLIAIFEELYKELNNGSTSRAILHQGINALKMGIEPDRVIKEILSGTFQMLQAYQDDLIKLIKTNPSPVIIFETLGDNLKKINDGH